MPDFHADMPHLNYLAVATAAILNFVIGGLWYSALFGQAWLKAAKLDPADMDKSGMGAMFAGAAGAAVIVSLSLAYVLELAHARTVVNGLQVAWTLWLGFVCATTVGDYLFLRRGVPLYAINMGLHLVTFSVGAVILTLWR